jgi:integrase
VSLPISGHVFRVERAKGPQWYVKYRLPDGRQQQKRLGPAWTGRGRPPIGYLTKRTAEAALDELLTAARRGALAGQNRTGVTFAEACHDFLRWIQFDRQRKRSTLDDYRSAVRAHLVPRFGLLAVEDVTTARIDAWRAELVREGRLCNRSINKLLTILHGVLERARKKYRLPSNPVAGVEKQPRRRRVSIDVYSTEEVLALVRHADTPEDGAIFLTAAFTGLRMGELLALRWRDVDFALQAIRVRASYTHRALDTPKNRTGRTVPMIDTVAQELARLGRRSYFTGPDDLVFPGFTGEYLDDSALRRRYKRARDRAGLRPLRFHDLRHTFGTHAIRTADPRELQEWMGHADFATTEIYLSYKPRAEAARRLAQAFEALPIAAGVADAETQRGSDGSILATDDRSCSASNQGVAAAFTRSRSVARLD